MIVLTLGNLSNSSFGTKTAGFNGLAASASALQVTVPNTAVIPSNNFVRKDINQTLSKSLKIADDEGLKIGANTSTFLLQKSVTDAVITNLEESSKIIFKAMNSGSLETILSVDGSTRSVGVNTDSPGAGLDVVGTLQVSDDVSLLNNIDISGDQSLLGSLTVGGDLYVSATSTLQGKITVGIENEVANFSILSPATAARYDLGSPDKPFRKIWVNDIGSNSTLFNIFCFPVSISSKSIFVLFDNNLIVGIS